MNRNLNSVSQLTEFAPLSPEPEESPGLSYIFSRFFKKNNSQSPSDANKSDLVCSETAGNTETGLQEQGNEMGNANGSPEQYAITIEKDRHSLPSVLSRISNLIALKNTGLQSYKDTDMKQYWMPDNVSKECFDCGEKFTTFRRRHHCRVCGQIFCSRCCNQEIPGKIMGCTGDLRACTYCGKVVLSYLQSADMYADLSADLRALQEDLLIKFGTPNSNLPSNIIPNQASNLCPINVDHIETSKRKSSVGYQEERFAQARVYSGNSLGVEERCRILQSSRSLRLLHEELSNPVSGLITITQKHNHQTCFSGSELVDWFLTNNKASVREQGRALGQALLEAGYLESVAMETTDFSDGYTLYRLRSSPPSPSPTIPPYQQQQQAQAQAQAQQPLELDTEETFWAPLTHHQDSTTTDSESEMSLPSSASLFCLDLNLQDSTVHISRPVPTTMSPCPPKRQKSGTSEGESQKNGVSEFNYVQDVVQTYRNATKDKMRAVNWSKASGQIPDNAEKEAFESLTHAFKLHNQNLLSQLLNSEGLSQSWSDVIIPLAQQVVDTIKPDLRNDTENMDIRRYVQLKKVPGGFRNECCILGGVACTKNVTHKAMNTRILNPRILLLRCAIMYQRVEGRFMSLEPVLLQEREYLRHIMARIAAMSPDLVLVQRNVSRLAQTSLLALGITLILNVKPSVLERVARVTGADIVQSVDTHVGQPKLGTCRYFHIETFTTDVGGTKTLMFLEGCNAPHLGCTVLLRGGTLQEMSKLKRVVSKMIYSLYNMRLERSFLMDEFANPPIPQSVDEFFEDQTTESESTDVSTSKDMMNLKQTTVDGHIKSDHNADHSLNKENISVNDSNISNSNRARKIGLDQSGLSGSEVLEYIRKSNSIESNKSSDSNVTKSRSIATKDKSLTDDRKINVESISDFSDPLHQYLNYEDEVFTENSSNQALAVADLPMANKFRKALDDTILSVSPHLKVPVPYLETESGRNSELRRYLPDEIFWSAQISDDKTASKSIGSSDPLLNNLQMDNRFKGVKLAEIHPFVVAKLTNTAESSEVQTLLANFRACGGRLPLPSKSLMTQFSRPAPSLSTTPPLLDALDPANHQKLAVLFCSFSHASNNAPAFCVNPWVVHMDFYGRNDIPLGDFLERYCFRTTYNCPSKTCDTPMIHHIRRFVHSGGAVHIALQELETTPNDDERILMWNWCPIYKLGSPVMVMSSDTWCFSFAKYLELRFHGDMYIPRGGASESVCDHSLHHEHIQYFGHKNLVAYFKYTKIIVWEVSLPPSVLLTQSEPYLQAPILEEMKKWALTGHEIFSSILSKLCNMAQNTDPIVAVSVTSLKQQLLKDQVLFKSRVEETQMKMTSPTLEGASDLSDKDLVKQSMWQLYDSLVLLKRLVAESVNDWNVRLTELDATVNNNRKREEKAKKSIDQKSITSAAAAGLGDIIEGVVTSHFPDNQNLIADGIPIEEKTLPSRLSQTSLCSESEVAVETDTQLSDTDQNDTSTLAVFVDESEDASCIEVIKDQKVILQTINEEINKVNITKEEWTENKVKDVQRIEEDNVKETLHDSEKAKHAANESDMDPSVEPEEGDTVVNSQTGSKLVDKKSMKTILSQLLPTAPAVAPITCPMSPQEHHCLPLGVSVPVIVYEREPSSIIAYALSCHDYRINLEEMCSGKGSAPEQPSPSPVNKRKNTMSESNKDSSSESVTALERRPGVLSFLRPNTNSTTTVSNTSRNSVDGGQSLLAPSGGDTSPLPADINEENRSDEGSKPKISKSQPSLHLEVQFSDASANFIVKIYFAEQFARLRASVFPAGEEAFVRSLSRCVQWAARGGKSGSNFCKTKDDRFILKEMTRLETQLFVDSALNYFEYMETCVSSNTPTLLGKIVGVYRVIYRNATSSNTLRSNLLVMENLFHARSVKHKFDLKGSVRNRLVNPNEQEGEIVLLDENLINRTCDSPLYIQPHAKTVLMQAIHQDTQFLASQSVMDYSLLVGLDEQRKELVVGIIDYIRTFTWDKKLETMVKKSGLLGGQGKQPTIVSPEEYRDRFIAAMHKYFLPVPDRWTGLGKGLDC
ncbi:1-phosphatidylinositol 3-phosphate 5-kinase fab1 isoform X2 [Lycorma delicatula]|uniref:1-phosphatidylinositol 3-phosphate 5-kinase fab1 isoform X2 n=1 Tax=Lycorma delicatula TaxID=130591 RepID=UPI003F516ADB